MIRQYFEITEYGWRVYVYYSVSHIYAEEILALMDKIGISEYDYIAAKENLTSRELDKGLCFSNKKERASVIVISDTSAPEEFMNSLAHEARHLERHIEQTLDIDPYGEEAAYLAGHISQLMFPKAKYFMCGCYGLIRN